jgi:ribosomal protein L44E
MPNPQLSADQLLLANQLLAEIRRQLDELSKGDPELRFALNRKVAKELTYDERGKPGHRRKLKLLKRAEQNGKCAVCPVDLPTRGAVLDRFEAVKGYTAENTRLICDSCDRAIQEERGFR